MGRRLLALAGLLGPLWFLGGSLIFGALRPGYDPLVQAISRLGEQGGGHALAWNLVGFATTGLLHLAFALALLRALGRRAAGAWMAGLMALAGLTLLGAGKFSCDPGCPVVPASADGVLHNVVGLTYFAVLAVLPLVGWRAFAARDAWRGLARPSLLVGPLLVALFVASPILFGPSHVGLGQRLFLLPAYAWQAVIAVRLFQQTTGDVLTRGRAMAPSSLA